jgi:hypothetical protein
LRNSTKKNQLQSLSASNDEANIDISVNHDIESSLIPTLLPGGEGLSLPLLPEEGMRVREEV